MHIERTSPISAEADWEQELVTDVDKRRESPAGFSVGLFWGNEKAMHKPFIAIDIWHWHIQIGWLW